MNFQQAPKRDGLHQPQPLQAFDLRDLPLFWWRELIVVGVFVVVLVFRAVAWLAPLVRRWMGVAGNDPKK
jgi:hypothetical protein